jgi:hypothetical protein
MNTHLTPLITRRCFPSRMRRQLGIGGIAALLAGAVVGLGPIAMCQVRERLGADTFVVTIGETTADNQHGVMTSDCAVVLPNGRFHVERRKQVSPSPTASVRVFESTLDSSQFDNLRRIVQTAGTSEAREYVAPPASLDVPWFTTVVVTVEASGQVRKSGYWKWRGETPELYKTRDDIRRGWQESEKKLQPIIEWFHRIEALNLSSSDTEPDQCAVR